MTSAVMVIAQVHRFFGYDHPCTNARIYLRQVPPPNLSLGVTRYSHLRQILAQPAHTRLQIRSRCILALLYAVHLQAAELVALRVKDYVPGTRNRQPALRVRSAAADHDHHWQPLTRAVGKIIDSWIKASQVRHGALICDLRKADCGQGRAVTAARIYAILRQVAAGSSAIGVRSLHRGLVADIAARSTRNRLTGLQLGREQRVRARFKGDKYVARNPLPGPRASFKKQGRL